MFCWHYKARWQPTDLYTSDNRKYFSIKTCKYVEQKSGLTHITSAVYEQPIYIFNGQFFALQVTRVH